MSSLALYEHFSSKSKGMHEQKQLTIVLHSDFHDHEVLARNLARFLRAQAAPMRVVVFGLDSHSTFINEILAPQSPFSARLAVAWGATSSERVCFGIVQNPDGTHRAIGAELSIDELRNEFALAATMTAQAIFIESKCLQVAPRGSHFSKTSRAHCDTFIRASNALIKSQHTLTLAYFLQPFATQPCKRILVDTSAISSVVYAACHIAVKAGGLPEMPIIDSFQSYEGLSDADLEDVENTLFVISASTSGNLARKAFGRGVRRQQLLTLYLLSAEQADQDALCTLRKDSGNPDGIPLLNSWAEKDCVLCRRGSAPIQIGGDLFLTALPETVAVTILKKHLPSDQQDIIARFAGLGVFRANRRIGESTAELSLDLAPIFDTNSQSAEAAQFRGEWDRLLRRHIPANITHLVYPNYPFAETLAEGVKGFGSQFVRSNFSVTSGQDLTSSPTVVNGCGIVITPCVDDAIELMGINRDLRTKIPGGTATYIFPFIRARSEAQAKGMAINLTFGDRGAGTYSLYSMHTLYLPENRSSSPWDKELKCIMALSDWIEESGEEVPEELTIRRALLNNATADGLINNLFWPDATGRALSIRSNFVLLPTRDGTRSLDQIDIFVVVSALLNSLRQAEGADSLRPTQFQRKVLSPGNFVRFNDGVIQAAILRAARGGELNYASTEDGVFSASMTDHILAMIDKASSEEGEALTEFMLAISVGALRLEEHDKQWILKTILESKNEIPVITSWFARALSAEVLPISMAE